jgi:ABC-type multidrug transport system ATPase subunit
MEDLALDMSEASFTWEETKSAESNLKGAAGNKGDSAEKLTGEGAVLNEKRAMEAKSAKKPDASKWQVEDSTSNSEKGPDGQTPPFTLDNISLQARPGELIAVIGTVGSGKTSLLSAIAGDMRQTGGSSKIQGRRAFCAQVPWIQNATVRDNITFGQEFIQERYDAVLEACSLAHDLKILPHGSFTEIGERGINLSGGQKHRISLARAIYFDADVVLLDDPLSAVDPHVGAHIFEHALCGMLKDKCRILATHQLHVLPRCDRIAILDKGTIIACDTFENLSATNTTFQQLIEGVNFEERVTLREKAAAAGATEASATTQPEEKVADQKALMGEEDKQVKGISSAVYLNYFRSTGSLLFPPLVLLVLAISQGGNIVTNLWLAWWSNNNFGYSTGVYVSHTTVITLWVCTDHRVRLASMPHSASRRRSSSLPRHSASPTLVLGLARRCCKPPLSASCGLPPPFSIPRRWAAS